MEARNLAVSLTLDLAKDQRSATWFVSAISVLSRAMDWTNETNIRHTNYLMYRNLLERYSMLT